MGAYFPTLMSAVHVRAVFTHDFVPSKYEKGKVLLKYLKM